MISGADPRIYKGLLVAGPGQWVLVGTHWGGRECLLTVEQVWGWKDRWFGLEGLRE